MVGGLLELCSKGGQDTYFICNPEMSFFNKMYKRHTNFSLETMKFQFNEDVDFGKVVNFTIPRKADLLKNISIQFELPKLDSGFKYVNYIGYSLIDYIEITIGNTVIQRLTGEWLYIYNQLSLNKNKKEAYEIMVGGKSSGNYNNSYSDEGTFIVPINFWFTRDIGLAIPIVALQYHEVEIKMAIRNFDECWKKENNYDNNSDNKPKQVKISNCFINLEYVYLDQIERKEFAQSNHEFLIKQIQYITSKSIRENQDSIKINLNFYNPIVELIFVVQRRESITTTKDYLYYGKTRNGGDTVKSAKLLLNNEERIPEMTGKELRLLNVLDKHTNVPTYNYIYLYSFSLKPESYQPAGSCNFSRFDNKELFIEFEDGIKISNVKVYAVSYNFLRISKGMGGLAYIN